MCFMQTQKQGPVQDGSLFFISQMRRLALGDRSDGAGIGAGTAVDAGTGIDDVVLVALGDRAHGAVALTGTATHASVADDIGHWIHLQTLKLKLLYHNFLKMQC